MNAGHGRATAQLRFRSGSVASSQAQSLIVAGAAEQRRHLGAAAIQWVGSRCKAANVDASAEGISTQLGKQLFVAVKRALAAWPSTLAAPVLVSYRVLDAPLVARLTPRPHTIMTLEGSRFVDMEVSHQFWEL
ncbi:hypothetical protein NL676_021421 [Syzygium grande]|nr:hypothetical protein NL676_021421 [Syzygium grande]